MGRRLWIGLALVLSTAHAHEHGGAGQGDRPGRTWADRLARPPQLAVSVAFDRDGRLWLARAADGHVVVSVSDDLGRSFSAAVQVNREPEHVAADGENRPKIAVLGDGRVVVAYTRSLDQPYSGDIRFARSGDGGRSFTAPATINDNRDVISHRFDALAVDARGRVALAWLDQRDRRAAERQGDRYAGAAVYYAVSADGGARFGPNRKLVDHACECCRVGLAWEEQGADAAPVVFWRHVYGRNVRDFALARLDGASPPRRASDDVWEIDACPHHGGALAVDEAGGYHLVWFNGGPVRQGLFYRHTLDRGQTFSPPIAFGDNDAQASHPAVLARGTEVHIAWREFDGKQASVRAMVSKDRGRNWSPARRIAATADACDYPLLVVGRDRPYLVWNTAREGVRVFDLAAGEDGR